MKKPIIKKETELELRKWCIQMANAWPARYHAQMNIGGNFTEINVLDCAELIYNWVKK